MDVTASETRRSSVTSPFARFIRRNDFDFMEFVVQDDQLMIVGNQIALVSCEANIARLTKADDRSNMCEFASENLETIVVDFGYDQVFVSIHRDTGWRLEFEFATSFLPDDFHLSRS